MKTAFYQLEGGGNWILSPDISGQVKGSYFLKDLQFINGIWNLGIIDPKDGTHLIASKPISDFTYQGGASYRTPEEIERVCGEFFGTPGYTTGGGSGSGFGMFEVVGANDILTDWPLPEDADMDKSFVGLNPMQVDVTALLVDGVKTIRFTTAPATGDSPNIIYNKI